MMLDDDALKFSFRPRRELVAQSSLLLYLLLSTLTIPTYLIQALEITPARLSSDLSSAHRVSSNVRQPFE